MFTPKRRWETAKQAVVAGLVTLMCARAFGAHKVCMVDPDGNRLRISQKFGADHILQVGSSEESAKPEDPSSCAAQLKAWAGGDGVDVIFDCAGFEGTLQVIASVQFLWLRAWKGAPVGFSWSCQNHVRSTRERRCGRFQVHTG